MTRLLKFRMSGYLIAITVSMSMDMDMISAAGAAASSSSAIGIYVATAAGQTEADEYTRYELLAPETASFKIYYEVTATTGGATSFYNPIRKGSEASDESVTDAMTGKPLHFEVVSGIQA